MSDVFGNMGAEFENPRGGEYTSPRDVPAAQAMIRRLCALQALVVTDVLGYDYPADCFCGDEGFWPYNDPGNYRNAGKAIDFIEDATLAAVAAHKQGGAE